MPSLARAGRALAFVLVAALAACGAGPSPEEQTLHETYRFTVHALRGVGRDPMAAASYQSAIETGASPVDYVFISAPENGKFSNMVWRGPAAPWTVVIKDGAGQSELVVEAFGADVGKPVESETVDLAQRRK